MRSLLMFARCTGRCRPSSRSSPCQITRRRRTSVFPLLLDRARQSTSPRHLLSPSCDYLNIYFSRLSLLVFICVHPLVFYARTYLFCNLQQISNFSSSRNIFQCICQYKFVPLLLSALCFRVFDPAHTWVLFEPE